MLNGTLVARPLRLVSLNSLRMPLAVRRMARMASSRRTFCIPELLKARFALEIALMAWMGALVTITGS
jgi:hypothetical protein